jgi:hypothetical protein
MNHLDFCPGKSEPAAQLMQQAEVLNTDLANKPGINDTGLTHDEGEFHAALVCCAPFSRATDLPFGQPFVHDSARKTGEPAGELQMRQTAREEVVNRADGHPQARGELPFVFVVRRLRLARAGNGLLICAHSALRAGEFIALRLATMRLHLART